MHHVLAVHKRWQSRGILSLAALTTTAYLISELRHAINLCLCVRVCQGQHQVHAKQRNTRPSHCLGGGGVQYSDFSGVFVLVQLASDLYIA